MGAMKRSWVDGETLDDNVGSLLSGLAEKNAKCLEGGFAII